LKRHIYVIDDKLNDNFSYIKGVVQIISSYVTDEDDGFGPEDWHTYLDLEVTDECPINLNQFYKMWHSRDVENPTREFSQTHLPPFYLPRHYREYDQDRCLRFEIFQECLSQAKKG